MAGHRRTPPQAARAQPAWFIVGSALVVLVAAAAIGYLAWGEYGGSAAEPRATDSPSPSPSPTEEPTPSPSPSPTPSPSLSPSPTAAPQRSTDVFVFNNSRISGLAASTAARARHAGWNVVGFGNWRGQIPRSTVYYPEGLRAEAELLASDLGLSQVQPRLPSMQSDRLTVIMTAQS